MKPIYFDKVLTISDIDDFSNSIDWVKRTEARYEAFMSGTPIEYTYGSGDYARTYTSNSFNLEVALLMAKLNEKFNTEYDICFLNRYDNEKMALGWHSDDSPEIDIDHPIAVVSIGAEREIWVKEKSYKGTIPEEDRYLLKSGSLFIMPAGFQKDYLHKIPKWDKPCGMRISLTYRKYKGS